MSDREGRSGEESSGSGFAREVADLREAVAGRGLLIGIDGPSGSGKSTVSKRIATDLGLSFLETGAMYRALTWKCLTSGVDVGDPTAVLEEADELAFESVGTVANPKFLVGGEDVTNALRSVDVAAKVSVVAGYIPVRNWMARAQREEMLRARYDGRGMIAEGRDVTTVVCPDADVRILLLADPEARLRRRVLETYGHVTEDLLEQTRELVSGRDETDSKVSSFLEAAPGVIAVDSSAKSVDEVVEVVISHVGEWVAAGVESRA